MKKVEYFTERKTFENLDKDRVMKILPHRDPMLMIDRVISVIPGKDENGDDVLLGTSVVAEKEISEKEPCLAGHFPGRPIFPGVLVVEAMAQSTAFAFVQEIERLVESELDGKSLELYLISVDDAKFKKMVLPGDTLQFRSKLYKYRGNFVFFECEALVDGKTVAEAKIRSFVGL